MAVIVLINLGLVALDASYIPWRDFYLRHFPTFTWWYGGQFKGIEPDRTTQAYLNTIDQLQDQVSQTGLQSPQVAVLLANLRDQSAAMIDENPFDVANKSGTFERIKYRVREWTGDRGSSKQAFSTFWSQAYLEQAGWTTSINFFNREIRPLIATNYYRRIGFNGEPLDLFWTIDIWFISLFGVEFLLRTIYLSRRYENTNWLDAVVWRWYDLFLLLPFWRWLRVIPALFRLNQSRLVNLNPLNERIVRGLIASVAIELTETIVIRIIDQTQNLIRDGRLGKWLLDPSGGRRYIDLNGVNEVEAISNQLVTILVYQVLPQIRPDIETLLYHTITSALSSLPAYSNLRHLPGMSHWSEQFTKQVTAEVYQNAYHAIITSLEDEAGAKLVQNLVSHFGEAFKANVQTGNSLQELESLTVELLDEVKLNYIQRIADEDWDLLETQTKQIYGLTRGSRR
jgi:hypothetical protein